MTNTETPTPWHQRYIKGIAALLGTATPTGIIALLANFDVHINAQLATQIVAAIGILAVVLAPANKTQT